MDDRARFAAAVRGDVGAHRAQLPPGGVAGARRLGDAPPQPVAGGPRAASTGPGLGDRRRDGLGGARRRRGGRPGGHGRAGRCRGRAARRRSSWSRPRAWPSWRPWPPAVPTGTVPANLPRRVVVVGDSQANALVKNAPKGLGSTLALTNGAVEGCGLVDDGSIRTARPASAGRSATAEGWPEQWAASARRGESPGGAGRASAPGTCSTSTRTPGCWPSARPAHDAYLSAQLQRGIDALAAAGSKVALLEVPCYEPVDGGGLIALPERGDDRRTAHLNQLLRHGRGREPRRT